MKVVSIVGGRPQFIKVAPVSRELRKEHTEVLVHTGQHYDYLMSEIFFKELKIPRPDYNLEVGSSNHGKQTGEMLARIEEVLLRETPDWVLVYGDMNSTLAGALAASKLHIPVAHVEAGMRSFNKLMPEEINRILTDHVSDLLFCPTETGVRNLLREGIAKGVHNVGDVMYDALLYSIRLARKDSRILTTLGVKAKEYLVATIHRPINTDNLQNLRSILAAFNELDEPIVFPVHLRTQKAMESLDWQSSSNVRLFDPIGYLDMLVLEENARMILTDSGGVQKEAYLFCVPCITLRNETGLVETVETGWNTLVGADPANIVEAVKRFRPRGNHPPIFGDGEASIRIVRVLVGLDTAVSGQRTADGL